MTTVTAKTHVSVLACGAKLYRHYIGAIPDEVGTFAQWQQAAAEMDQALGESNLGPSAELHIWHMDSPELPEKTRQRISNLEDGDPNAPGYQTWAGCYLDPDGAGPAPGCLDVGVFPAGWRAEDPPMLRSLTAADVARAIGVFGHEAGHRHAGRFGLHQSALTVELELTKLWQRHRSGGGHNEAEGFAEDTRALAGPLSVRGTFSDGRVYTEAMNRPLFTLIRCGPWLRRNVGQVDTGDYQAWDDRLVWRQYDWILNWQTWQYERKAGAWFSVTRDFKRWKWARLPSGADGWAAA